MGNEISMAIAFATTAEARLGHWLRVLTDLGLGAEVATDMAVGRICPDALQGIDDAVYIAAVTARIAWLDTQSAQAQTEVLI